MSMIILPTVSWVYPGTSVPTTEWPKWIIFLNFGADEEKIVVHDWDGKIICLKGDTLHRDSVGRMYVVKSRD